MWAFSVQPQPSSSSFRSRWHCSRRTSASWPTSRRVYRYAIDQHDAVRTTGIERPELIRAGAEIREYFNNDQRTLNIQVQDNGRQVSLFNARETAHMEDVKNRFQAVNRAQEFSLLYALTYIAVVVLWSREVSTRAMAVNVAVGSVICLAVIGVGVGISLAGFEGRLGRLPPDHVQQRLSGC